MMFPPMTWLVFLTANHWHIYLASKVDTLKEVPVKRTRSHSREVMQYPLLFPGCCLLVLVRLPSPQTCGWRPNILRCCVWAEYSSRNLLMVMNHRDRCPWLLRLNCYLSPVENDIEDCSVPLIKWFMFSTNLLSVDSQTSCVEVSGHFFYPVHKADLVSYGKGEVGLNIFELWAEVWPTTLTFNLCHTLYLKAHFQIKYKTNSMKNQTLVWQD